MPWRRRSNAVHIKHPTHAKVGAHHVTKMATHEKIVETLKLPPKWTDPVSVGVAEVRRVLVGRQKLRIARRFAKDVVLIKKTVPQQRPIMVRTLMQPYRQLLEPTAKLMLQMRIQISCDLIASVFPQQPLPMVQHREPIKMMRRLQPLQIVAQSPPKIHLRKAQKKLTGKGAPFQSKQMLPTKLRLSTVVKPPVNLPRGHLPKRVMMHQREQLPLIAAAITPVRSPLSLPHKRRKMKPMGMKLPHRPPQRLCAYPHKPPTKFAKNKLPACDHLALPSARPHDQLLDHRHLVKTQTNVKMEKIFRVDRTKQN